MVYQTNIIGNLEKIALILEGLEDTIIHKLIDRAQFCTNDIIYQQGRSGFEKQLVLSLFELRLLYQERMDAEFGRFLVPEERPFNLNLPSPKRKINQRFSGLCITDFQAVNLTYEIKKKYLHLIPFLCNKGDDGQYGSSAEHDVYALQAISTRIHFGAMYVAESKYLSSPNIYDTLIARKDKTAIMEKLTRKSVEEKILKRVNEKVNSIQQYVNPKIRKIVSSNLIVKFYRDTIIPLTKEGEVLYLLARRKK